MKVIMMLISAALISSASAADKWNASPSDSWAKLRSNREVLILQPHVSMQFGSAGLFNACATDDELRSVSPVKTCTAYKTVVHGNPNSEAGGYIEYVCTNYEMKDVVVARDHEEKVCTKWSQATEANPVECLKWSTVEARHPREFKLEVVSPVGEMYMSHLFNKTYALPDCM